MLTGTSKQLLLTGTSKQLSDSGLDWPAGWLVFMKIFFSNLTVNLFVKTALAKPGLLKFSHLPKSKGLQRQRLMGSAVAGFNNARTITKASATG